MIRDKTEALRTRPKMYREGRMRGTREMVVHRSYHCVLPRERAHRNHSAGQTRAPAVAVRLPTKRFCRVAVVLLQRAHYFRARWLFTLLYLGGLRIPDVSANTIGAVYCTPRRGRSRALGAGSAR